VFEDLEDAPDLDELELLTRSGAYRAIAKRQEFIIGQKLAELVQDNDASATAKIRGFIEGVRACGRLPALIKTEIQERRLRGRKH
jgi:hypothetical protein